MSQDNVGLVKADIIPAAAREAHQRAGACVDERRFVDSIVHAEEAARLCPNWAAPWWILSVGYKHALRWEDALRACDRAIELDPDDCEGPRWNAGIAATALGQWERARAAWASVGIKMPPGDGPIEMRIGPTPVRVSPAENAEVVWCDRIDPCRAIIHSVPLPESERRYGDLLLHDGEARGRRQFGNDSVPVFDELDVLERSAYGTWEIVVRCADPEQLQSLIAELKRAELGVEDWTGSVQMLCAACSLGEPHDHQERDRTQGEWQPERRLGVAARSLAELSPLRRAFFWWRSEVVSVRQVL